MSGAQRAQSTLPGFASGALTAVALALAAALITTLSTAHTLLGTPTGISSGAPVVLLTGAYLLYLMRKAPGQAGRALLLSVWAASGTTLLLTGANLDLLLVTQLLLITVTRSLLFARSAAAVAADGVLTGAAAGAALWVLSHAGSAVLATWTFFLLQALWPEAQRLAAPKGPGPRATPNRAFERAHQTAVRAIRRLTREATGAR
ncbi:MAG: hypothetical protein AAGI15_02510 [Pseudomonadota bacterium]